ncbi:MAG: hypothetical protein NTY94_12200 [Alphaproteobacteria bacterium]|jgi:hypothetical protein|nr:hypothetical protein [Alphaproteobacteria bacterium]
MNIPSRLALATLLALAASPAAAQSSALGGSSPLSNAGQDNNRWKEQKKPSALPGSRFTSATPAAPERPAADMAPNEALFDAVNRGDIAAARDALGRGADVDTRNMLGLTALETAIDLGRNDLTFLLLSMRGASSGSSPPPPPADTRTPPRQAAAQPAPARVAAVPQPAPPRPRPAYNDPGTPVPQAGFLGFGPSR